jgi:nitrogen fixation NifU-like protein
MTETVKGKSRQEAVQMMERFHDLLTTAKPASAGLGKLAVFSGVREFPARVKCATLAWHTLKSALTDAAETVSTE